MMKSLVTAVGKFLRKLRLDANEVLYDMSQRVGCSSAFISSLELGKRPVPSEFQQKIVQIYGLSPEQQEEFQRAIDQSTKSVTIDFEDLGDSSKEAALVFARRLKTMEEKEAKKLLDWLNNPNKGGKK